jgi:hypothetical protein
LAVFVDNTVKEIDGRLSELNDEVAKLTAARAALVGNGGVSSRPSRRGPGRPRGRRSAASAATTAATTTAAAPRAARSGPGRPRGRRGGNTRSTQALELVRQRPGITIPELAKEMKIEPNYLYRVLPKLVTEGQVKREGKGWHPAA